MTFKHIAVIGAGTMGNGIAQVCATSGYQVTMVDVNPAALEKGMHTIAQSVEKLFSKGKLTEAARNNALTRILTHTELEVVADADVVIEAATENKAIKLDIFSK